MRILLTIVLAAAGLWAGYWFVGSTGLKSGFEMWFDARRAEGWAADYAELEVQGFPNRFDATFNDLSLADPGTGLAWQAPFFQILALSYRPNHVIAVWPNAQKIATPLEKYDLQSADMRASLVLMPNELLGLERTTLTAQELIISPTGQSEKTAIQALTMAVERIEDQTATYRFGLFADGLAPSLPWRAHVDPNGALPDKFDALSADLSVEFDTPWDRRAIEVARPQPRMINVKLAKARWGQLELQAAGKVKVDPTGLPTGEITIKATNWRDILRLAVASGALPEGLGDTLEDGLSLVAQLAGNPKTLDVPLGFRNGQIFLGPVPVGPAPVLKLR